MPATLSAMLAYVFTGGLAAVVDAGLFLLLLHAQLPPALAGTLSFAVAAVVNYTLTARHVFSRAVSWRGFLLFVLGALGGLIVNVGVTTFAITKFDVPPLFAKIAGIGIAFFVNFAINARFVFAGPRRS